MRILRVLGVVLTLLFAFSNSTQACDGFQVNTISTTYVGGGVYEVTIEYCEEVSNGAGASVHGVLAIINGANIISTSTPSITSASTGVTMNYNQLSPNSAEWGDWDNDGAPIFMDDGDPQECFTLVLQVDGAPTSVQFAGSSNATPVGSGFVFINGRWTCGQTVVFPPPVCSAAWTPPSVCPGAAPIDLNTTTTGVGVFSGAGVNSASGMFDPSGLSGNIPVTFTVGDALFNCVQTNVIQIVELDPALVDETICQGDCVQLDATVQGAESCVYTLILGDIGGDGWGVANIDVYINGVLYLMNQTVVGTENSIAIPLQDGDVMTFFYQAGGSNGQNSITLLDPSGTQLASVTNPAPGWQGGGVTANCAAGSGGCNDYTLSLYDSWGDGWDNFFGADNSVTILINGVPYVTNYTFTNGSQDDITIPVQHGDDITIQFNVGSSWSSECSMELFDGDGNQVGPTMNPGNNWGNGFTTTVSCPVTTYTWTPTTGLSASDIADPNACPNATTTYSVTIDDPASGCTFVDQVTITVTPPPVPNFTVSGDQCLGGTLNFTNTGTAGAYTWTFENGTPATALGSPVNGVTFNSVGTHDVELRTGGGSCVDSITIPITIYALPQISANVTNPACGNGNATVSASATNTSGYTFNWTPGLGAGASHPVSADGVYQVIVTDVNGCRDTAQVTVTIPDDITASVVGTNVSCNGGNNGTATVTASGGTGVLTYNWVPAPGGGQGTPNATGLTAQTYTCTITDANNCTETVTFTPTQPTALSLSISGTNISCNGGSNGTATVTASGGTGGYTYNWSPAPGGGQGTNTVTGLSAQAYTVTVTDGATCQQSISFTPTQPVALTGNIVSQTNVSCNGGNNGSVTVTGVDGTPNYQYNIGGGNQVSGTFNGLSQGNYNIVVTDDNNCTTTIPVTITQPTALAANIPAVTIDCNGDCDGQATVTASGGSGGYTYQWDNTSNDITATTAANLCAGTFNVTVADAADATCTVTASVTITDPAVITSSINGTNITCNGIDNGTATVTAAGGTGGLNYNWAPAPGGGQGTVTATGLSNQAYTVTITDGNNCTATETFTPTEPTALTLNINGSAVSCNGGNDGTATVTPNGGTPGYTYNWVPAPGGGQGTVTATGLTSQNYTVTVTDNNTCVQTISYTPTEPTALSGTITAQTNVSCNAGNNGTVTVSGVDGSPGYQYNIGGGNQGSGTFNGLNAGNYNVIITDNNTCTFTVPVTITEPTALAANIPVVTIDCNGDCDGQATVNASGGSGGYTYLWDNTTNDITATTAANLCAGTFNVTVADAADATCTVTASVTITDPAAITSSINGTNITCNGFDNGTATVTAGGGTGGLSYNWAPAPGGGQGTVTATGLSPQAYTVTITDGNGCIATETFTPTEPSAVSLSITGTAVSCNGGNDGTSTVTPSGGTPAYSYNWVPAPGAGQGTNAATGLISTTYTVTVTDNNGCSANTTYTPTQPVVLTGTIVSQTNVTCNGANSGSVTVSGVNGTPGYQYDIGGGNQASGTFNGLAAGNYTIVVTDNNTCTANIPVTITEPAVLTAAIAPLAVDCNGDCDGQATVTPGGGSGAYTFSWDNLTFDNTATTTANLCAGTLYTVTIADQADPTCQVTANVTPTEPTAIVITPAGTTPANCGASDGTASVTVAGGSAPYSYVWAPAPGAGQGTANASAMAAGPYTVTVTDNNGCSEVLNINVPNNGAPTVTEVGAAHIDVLCNGASTGQAQVNVVGGTAPYTYVWAPNVSTGATATGLAAGTYTVTVSDFNNCADAITITITEPTVLNAVASVTADVSCNGGNNGSLNVNVSGGTPGYNYQWYSGTPAGTLIPGATNATLATQTAGDYYVEITDNNTCGIQSAVVTITEPAAITITETITDADCNGASTGEIALVLGGGTPGFTYAWTGPNGFNSGVEDITGLEAGNYDVTVTDNNGCTETGSYVVGEPTAIGLTPSSTASNCGQTDGSVSVVAVGGTVAADYTYSWSNSVPAVVGNTATVNSLAAGTYTVTVTDDNLCTATTTATISDQSGGSVAGVITNVDCFGASTGEVDITTAGGTAPFTYAWTGPGAFSSTNEDITGLIAGTYDVTITDNVGCQITGSYTVLEPADLVLSNTSVDVTCNAGTNGSINLNVTGGTSPYTYAWTGPNGFTATSQDISTLEAGSYNVIVTDNNNCTETVTIDINEPAALSLGDAITDVLCNGGNDGSIDLTVNGGTAPYSFSWTGPNGYTSVSEDPSVMEAGTYDVTVTDNNGCIITDSYVINEPAALTLNLTPTDPNCGNADGSITAAGGGGSPGYNYAWFDDALLTSNIGAGTSVSNLAPGTYYCQITDVNGCVLVENVTLTNQAGPAITVSLNSNATGFGVCDGDATVNIVGGSAPFTFAWDNGETTQTATALCSGNNCVTVTDNNGCIANACVNVTEPSNITITLTPTMVDCNGDCDGEIATTISGGVAPYTYAWAHGPTSANLINLCAGTYDLIVTDNNGNTQNASVTIIESPLMTLDNLTDVDNLCFGDANGTGSITVSGGTPGFTYEWTDAGATVLSTTDNVSGLIAGTYDVTATDALGCQVDGSIVITTPTDITTTPGGTNANCGLNDGSLTVNSVGGTGAFTYNWYTDPACTAFFAAGDNIPNVGAATYYVVATDANNCTDTSAYTISNLAGPSITLAEIFVSCNGGTDGSINSTVMGGLGPYTYAWTGPNGFTSTLDDIAGIEAGNYTLNITDANGCIESASTTINEPTALGLTMSSTDVSCDGGNDGDVTVAIAGGTPAYSVSWEDQATTNVVGTGLTVNSLPAGTYCANVTDNRGCTATNCVTINSPAAITVLVASTDASCGQSDGTISEVSISGGSGNYVSTVWTDAGNGAVGDPNAVASGAYTYTVTDDNGCTGTAIANVADLTGPTVSVSGSTNVTCFNACDGTATVNVSGGAAPYSYVWTPAPGAGQGTDAVSGLCDGTYNIEVTDDNGCTNATTVTITEPTQVVASVTGTTNVTGSGLTNGAITSNTVGGTPGYTYAWYENQPPYVAIGQTTANASNLGAGEYCLIAEDANGCVDTTCVLITEPSPLTSLLSGTDALCDGAADGTATVVASGGNAPYTYAWYAGTPPGGAFTGQNTATATNLTAGDYYVIVTDGSGNVHTSAVYTINQPTAVAGVTSVLSDFNGEDVSCFGSCDGSATIVASGGTAPYTYEWDANAGFQATPIAIGLCEGTYTVTIRDAQNCIVDVPVTLTQPTQITAADLLSDPSCFGFSNGEIDITPSNGVGPYTFQWNDPAFSTTEDLNNIPAGTYDVEVTDANGCVENFSYTITDPAELILTETNTGANCGLADGSVNVTVQSGTPPYTYQWDAAAGNATTPMVNNLPTGCYDVTVTDARGCVATITSCISDLGSPNVTILTQTDVTCNGGNDGFAQISVSGGLAPLSYNWVDAGTGLNLVPPQTTASAFNLPAGTYEGQFTDANGCVGQISVTIDEPDPLSTTPNGIFDVTCNNGNDGIASVLVSGGTLPYTYLWSDAANQTTQTATGLLSGAYTVLITDGNNCTTTENITINNALPIVLTTATIDAFCGSPSGTASVEVQSGGTAPYSYLWTGLAGNQSNDTAIALIPATHDVTVTDANGCIGTAQAIVGDIPAATINLGNISDVSCFQGADGEITASISGTGTPPYTIEWFDSLNQPINQTGLTATGLSAGGYYCVVTDVNGCVSNSHVQDILEPTGMALVMAANDASCFGFTNGDATVTASGGTGPYTYAWDDPLNQTTFTAVNLAADDYTVTVTDFNGCTLDETVTVGEPLPMVIAEVVTDANCGQADGNICVNVTGGAGGYNYAWNTGQTNSCIAGLVANSYIVTVTDMNGCSQQEAIDVQDLQGPTAVITDSTNLSCYQACDGSATVDMSNGFGTTFSVQWDANAANQTTPTASNLCAGIYTVTITDNLGCISSVNVGITEPDTLSTIANVQNPLCFGSSDGEIELNMAGGTAPFTYQWYDNGGTPLGTNALQDGLASGDYTVVVDDVNGCSETFNFTLTDPVPFTGTVIEHHVSCNGFCDGSIDFVPTNGTGPYTYLWDAAAGNQLTQTAVNLCPGTYSVTVTDAIGCTYTTSGTIIEPTVLGGTVNTYSDVSCNGLCDGFIDVLPSGGAGQYTYQWNNGAGTNNIATNLCANNYTVTITDSNLCTVTVDQLIIEPTPIGVAEIVVDNVCFGSCEGTIQTFVSGGTSPYTYQWDDPNFSTTSAIQDLCAGNYQVTITDDNGCDEIRNYTISEPTNVSINATITDANCLQANGSIALNVFGATPPFTYQWNDPGTQTSSTATALNAGCYNVVITDAAGCNYDSTFCINDIAGPTVNLLGVTDVTCFGLSNGIIDGNAAGGTGGLTLTWYDAAGTSIPALGGNTSATNMPAGCYTFEALDGAGCLASFNACIAQPAVMNSAITNSTDPVCFDGCDGNAFVQASGGDGNYNYLWNDGQTVDQAVGLCSGNYSVTVTDGNGCTTTSNVFIDQPTQVDLSIVSTTDPTCTDFCDGIVNLETVGGNAPYTYTWTTGANLQFNNNVCSGPQMVYVADAFGCPDSVQINLTNPQPLAYTLTLDDPTCGECNGTAQITPGSLIGGAGNYQIQWNDFNQQTGMIANDMCPGNWMVSVTDDHGCQLDSTFTLTDIAGPDIAGFATTEPLCYGMNNGSAQVFPTGGTLPYTYMWDANANNQVQDSAIVLASGNYCVTVTDANGCQTFDCTPLLEPAELYPVPDIPRTICYGDSTQIWASAGGGTQPYTIQWSDNNQVYTGPLVVQPQATTNYCFYVTDANGCGGSFLEACVTITVLPPVDVDILTVNQSICDGDSILIEAVASGGNGLNLFVFDWTDHNGNVYQPVDTTQGTTSEILVTPTDSTVYYVEVNDGCSASDGDSVIITINPVPTLDVDVLGDYSGCPEFTTTFQAITDSTNLVYFDFDCDGNVDYAGLDHTQSFTYPYTGYYDVCATVENEFGCTASFLMEDSIFVYPTPTADFTVDPSETSLLNPFVEFTSQSTGADHYEWNFGDSSIVGDFAGATVDTARTTGDIEYPYHEYIDTGYFPVILTVSNQYGCVDTAMNWVFVKHTNTLFAPKGFTPDGNGINDVFYVEGVGLEEAASFELLIFNRWGELIFEADHPSIGWDGTYKGKMVQDGVYVWKVRLEDPYGTVRSYVGHVTKLQ